MKATGYFKLRELRLVCAALGVWTLSVNTAYGIDVNAQIGFNYETSDNVTLSPSNEQSDHRRELRANVQVDGEAPSYSMDLDYYFRGRDYRDNGDIDTNPRRLPDNNIFSGRALVLWNPLPRRFQWDLMHLRTESAINNIQAATSLNEETRNIISTGPDFGMALSGADDLILRLRYTDIGFERSKLSENDRYAGILEWNRELTEVSEAKLVLRHDEVEFRAGEEITFSQFYGEYGANLRRGNYQIRLGYNQVDGKTGEEDGGLVLRLAGELVIAENPVEFLYSRNYTDTSLGVVESILASETFDLESGAGGQNVAMIDALEQEIGSVIYTWASICERCEFELGLSYQDLDYQTLPRDETVYGGSARFKYALSHRLSSSIFGRYTDTEYSNVLNQNSVALADYIVEYGLSFTYGWLRDMQLTLSIQQEEKSSNSPALHYEEFTATFGFLWFYGGN